MQGVPTFEFGGPAELSLTENTHIHTHKHTLLSLPLSLSLSLSLPVPRRLHVDGSSMTSAT